MASAVWQCGGVTACHCVSQLGCKFVTLTHTNVLVFRVTAHIAVPHFVIDLYIHTYMYHVCGLYMHIIYTFAFDFWLGAQSCCRLVVLPHYVACCAVAELAKFCRSSLYTHTHTHIHVHLYIDSRGISNFNALIYINSHKKNVKCVCVFARLLFTCTVDSS